MLKYFGKKIGSDFRLIFLNQGFVKNLKTIKTNKKNFKFYFLLVFPNIKCSTKNVYSKVNIFSKKINISPKKLTLKKIFKNN